jgi:outer membrane protein assembly factor BamB
LYAVSGAGVLTCANLEDGERPWKLRLDGKFSGSPVMAGPMLYIGSELGVLIGVDTQSAVGEEGKVTGRLELGEPILCTPSLSGKSVYVRSDGSLWKVGGR